MDNIPHALIQFLKDFNFILTYANVAVVTILSYLIFGYFFTAFQLLMQTKQSTSSSAINNKRPNAGHEKTQTAICLLCFKQYQKDPQKKFWFSRYNKSSMKDHMKVHDCSNDFVSCENPRAVEAMAVFRKIGCATRYVC